MRNRNRHISKAGSWYLLARKEELSARQKDAIIEFVVERMLGRKVVSGMYELEEYLEAESEFIDQAMENRLLESVGKGQAVFSGRISFADGEGLAALLGYLWKALEDADSASFSRIATHLPR